MIVSITGHRPEDINDMRYVTSMLKESYSDLGATRVITGGAHGVDLVAAKTAYDQGIPFWLVRPYMGHKVPQGWREWYLNARIYAEKVVVLNPSDTYPGPWVFHNRNHWMVDNSDTLIAVWTGKESGGTYATVQYAIGKDKKIWQIEPNRMMTGWLQ